jgi:hypothetical protein
VTLRSPQGPVPTPEPTLSITVETPQHGPDAADALLRARGIDPYPPQPLPNPEADLPGYVPESQVNPGPTQMPATEMPATEMPAIEMPVTEMPATEPALAAEAPPAQVNMSNLEIPSGFGQEYQVDAETEEVLAKLARGEMTAEEAMAQAGKASAPSAERSAATAAA